MPALREHDFDKLATQVVDEFLAKRAKLADAAANVAMQNGLNPDQIERLTQSANTMAFLRMMEDTKAQGGQDLTQEFDPVDSRQVIRIVIDNTGVHVEADPSVDVQPTGGAPGGDELPDEMSALRAQGSPGEMPGGMPEGMPGGEPPEMDAAGGAPSKKAPPFGKKNKKDGDDDAEDDETPKKSKKPESEKEAGQRMMRTRKLAGVLEDQRLQADIVFEDTYEKLAARFKRIYTAMPFEAFEKDALAEHGDEVGIQVLNILRTGRNMPALGMEEACSKVAALEDRHLTEESVELSLFGALVKTAREAKRLDHGIAVLRSQCA
jgi:hypothetical protein